MGGGGGGFVGGGGQSSLIAFMKARGAAVKQQIAALETGDFPHRFEHVLDFSEFTEFCRFYRILCYWSCKRWRVKPTLMRMSFASLVRCSPGTRDSEC